MSPKSDASVAVTSSDGALKISLGGTLNASTLPGIWKEAIDPIRVQRPKRVVIDAAQVSYCDGSGLGLFVELRRAAAQSGGEASVENLKPELQALLDRASLRDPRAPQLSPPPSP